MSLIAITFAQVYRACACRVFGARTLCLCKHGWVLQHRWVPGVRLLAAQAWLLSLVQRAPLNPHNPPAVRAAMVAALRERLLRLLQTL
jgi:hypothetical protein